MNNETSTLRTAARMLRSAAQVATPGPWRHVVEAPCGTVIEYAYIKAGDHLVADCGATDGDDVEDGNALYIATMHPGVALALAAWFDREADGPTQPEALNVARTVLGEA